MQFNEEFLGWGATPQDSSPLPTYYPPEMPVAPVTPEAEVLEVFEPPILIQNYPLTAIDESLNPQIPGPSAVPGLWD
jgi:hypothetical protein